MPAIYTGRFKNTFFNRISFKYNVHINVQREGSLHVGSGF